jgi:group I intron endonuclease
MKNISAIFIIKTCMAEIYKITNPKDKVYIGQSLNSLDREKSYRNEYKTHIGPKLYNSIKKYGWENHKFEIIEECMEEILNEREKYWIKHFNSVNKGLNLQYGGKGGRPSEETKLKKSKSMTGKKASLETKIKMSNSKKGHSMYNDEWRSKMKKVWSLPSSVSKPIFQYDKDGIFIKEWESSLKACQELNIGTGTISSALNGRYKTAGGYIWKFKL